MSQILRLEVPDSLFTTLSQKAAAEQVQPEEVALRVLQDNLITSTQTSAKGAPSLFRQMFGVADLGSATGLDNEEIDADLAKEYARGLDH